MSLPAAFSIGAMLAVVTPLAPIHAIFLGGLTLPLIWVGLALWALLARSGRRAWLVLTAITLIGWGLIVLHELVAG